MVERASVEYGHDGASFVILAVDERTVEGIRALLRDDTVRRAMGSSGLVDGFLSCPMTTDSSRRGSYHPRMRLCA